MRKPIKHSPLWCERSIRCPTAFCVCAEREGFEPTHQVTPMNRLAICCSTSYAYLSKLKARRQGGKTAPIIALPTKLRGKPRPDSNRRHFTDRSMSSLRHLLLCMRCYMRHDCIMASLTLLICKIAVHHLTYKRPVMRPAVGISSILPLFLSVSHDSFCEVSHNYGNRILIKAVCDNREGFINTRCGFYPAGSVTKKSSTTATPPNSYKGGVQQAREGANTQ